MSDGESSLGRLGIRISIVGVVLPACLYVLAALLPGNQGWPYGACELLFVVLQLVAVACGVAARRTPAGRRALLLSGSLLALAVVLVGAVLVYFACFFVDR